MDKGSVYFLPYSLSLSRRLLLDHHLTRMRSCYKGEENEQTCFDEKGMFWLRLGYYSREVGDRVEMGRNREYRSGFLSALEHRFLFCTFRRRARSVTEVIPFGGNTFQGPWNTRRKRQLAQKILAYVEIEATRASKRYRQGRNERMNEYAFHSRGMEFVVTLAV